MTAALRISLLLGMVCLTGCANGSAGLARAWGYDLDVSAPQPIEAPATPTSGTDETVDLSADPFLASPGSADDTCTHVCF